MAAETDLAKLRLLYSSKGISKVKGEFRDIQSSAKKSFGNVSSTISTGMLAVGAATAAAVGLVIKANITFDAGMRNIGTLGVENMEALTEGVLDYSEAMGQDAVQATNDMYQALSAGISEADALGILEESAIAAAVGVGKTGDALDLGTSLLNAYGRAAVAGANDQEKFSNIMGLATKAVKLGKTTIGELGSVMGRVAPIASQAGISMEELFASIATSTSQGIKTSEAISGLKAAITSILKPTKEATALSKAMGFDFSASGLKAKGLGGFVAELTEKIQEQGPALVEQRDKMKEQIAAMEEAEGGTKEFKKELSGLKDTYKGLESVSEDQLTMMAAMFGSVEGLNIMLSQASEGGAAKFKQAVEGMGTAQADMMVEWEKFKKENPKLAYDQMQATIRRLAIDMGALLLPILKTTIEWLRPIVNLFGWFVKTPVGGAITKIAVGLMLLALPLGLILKTSSTLFAVWKGLAGLKVVGWLVGLATGWTAVGAAATTAAATTTAAAAATTTAVAATGTSFAALTATTTATGVAATGVGAMLAGVTVAGAMAAAGAFTIAASVIGFTTYELYQSAKAIYETNKAHKRSAEVLADSFEMQNKYITKLREKGIVLSNEAMKEMDLAQRTDYINRQVQATKEGAIKADIAAALTREQLIAASEARLTLGMDNAQARAVALSGITAQQIFDISLLGETEREAKIRELEGIEVVAVAKAEAVEKERTYTTDWFKERSDQFEWAEHKEREIARLKNVLLEEGLDASVSTLRRLQQLQAERDAGEEEFFAREQYRIATGMDAKDAAAYKEELRLAEIQETQLWFADAQTQSLEAQIRDSDDLWATNRSTSLSSLKAHGTEVLTHEQWLARNKASRYRKGTEKIVDHEKKLTELLGAEKDAQLEKFVKAAEVEGADAKKQAQAVSDFKLGLMNDDTDAMIDNFEKQAIATANGLGMQKGEYEAFFADLKREAEAFRQAMQYATDPSQTGSPSLIQQVEQGFAKWMPGWRNNWEAIGRVAVEARGRIAENINYGMSATGAILPRPQAAMAEGRNAIVAAAAPILQGAGSGFSATRSGGSRERSRLENRAQDAAQEFHFHGSMTVREEADIKKLGREFGRVVRLEAARVGS